MTGYNGDVVVMVGRRFGKSLWAAEQVKAIIKVAEAGKTIITSTPTGNSYFYDECNKVIGEDVERNTEDYEMKTGDKVIAAGKEGVFLMDDTTDNDPLLVYVVQEASTRWFDRGDVWATHKAQYSPVPNKYYVGDIVYLGSYYTNDKCVIVRPDCLNSLDLRYTACSLEDGVVYRSIPRESITLVSRASYPQEVK